MRWQVLLVVVLLIAFLPSVMVDGAQAAVAATLDAVGQLFAEASGQVDQDG